MPPPRAPPGRWPPGYLRDPAIGLVVLDEMTYAFKYQWLPLDEVLAAFAARPPMQHVIVTGRAAPEA
jgi:cob(I)alamin adenosyltransferase